MFKFILLFISLAGLQQEKEALLTTRVTLKIYGAETLESVIMRIECETGQHIRYSTLMLLPYRAKARDYQGISVKEILDEQLSGIPIKYQAGKKQLELY